MNIRKFILSIICSLVFLSPAFAQNVVIVPNDLADKNANLAFTFPFNCEGTSPFLSMRWQQVYISSEIGQAGMIDKVSFRLEPSSRGGNGFSASYPGITIQLSTTDKNPVGLGGNPLSNTFTENIGPDVKTVYSGNLNLSAPDCVRDLPGGDESSCPFDVMIPLQQMFPYDPAGGNLLLDIRVPQCPELGKSVGFDLADSINNADDKISVLFTSMIDDPMPGSTSEFGLVTQFGFFTPRSIPTLSEWGLIATAGILGIAGLLAVRKRKFSS